MTPQRFQQIRNVFEAAVEREVGARSGFLEEACRGDEDLRAEVSRLLTAHARPAGVLEPPAANIARMEGRRRWARMRFFGNWERAEWVACILRSAPTTCTASP